MGREKITDCGCPDGPGQGHRDRCPTLVALAWPDGTPKVAPVQGYTAGLPWSLQLEAYDAYAKRWSSQPAMIDLDRRGCRGGFSTGELDEFIPGWRDRVSEIAALRARVAALEAAATAPAAGAPIPMILHCPVCGLQHIDEPDDLTPDWTNPPHKSHLCHGCRCIWRPCDQPTEGVQVIGTRGKADTWPLPAARLAAE